MVDHQERRLVIGLGGGRCGTRSLTYLLNAQPNTKINHEHFIPMPWSPSPRALQYFLEFVMAKADTLWYGDVAFWHLNYAPSILEILPQTKYVVIKRDKDAVIASKLLIYNSLGYCAPVHFRSKYWDPKWDKVTFDIGGYALLYHAEPHFDLPKEEAIAAQYDLYYERVDEFMKMYPDSFKLYDTEDILNNVDTQMELFRWLGMTDVFPVIGIHVNKSIDQYRDEHGVQEKGE